MDIAGSMVLDIHEKCVHSSGKNTYVSSNLLSYTYYCDCFFPFGISKVFFGKFYRMKPYSTFDAKCAVLCELRSDLQCACR
jgi:hypothetical protein